MATRPMNLQDKDRDALVLQLTTNERLLAQIGGWIPRSLKTSFEGGARPETTSGRNIVTISREVIFKFTNK